MLSIMDAIEPPAVYGTAYPIKDEKARLHTLRTTFELRITAALL